MTKAELSSDIADLFFQIGAHAKRSMRVEVEREGLTLPQSTVLTVLADTDERLSARALGEHCHMLASTATGVIDRLEQQGYVRRERDSHDRRVVWVGLTDSGAELADRLPRFHRRLGGAFAALPARDLEQMRDLVTRVVASMNEEGGR
jgi:DNA-binding MarR family transcriptional regulator